MIRKLGGGRWEDTNDGGARSAAGGRHCPRMSPPHGGSTGSASKHAAHWAEIWVMLRCKLDVFRCSTEQL